MILEETRKCTSVTEVHYDGPPQASGLDRRARALQAALGRPVNDSSLLHPGGSQDATTQLQDSQDTVTWVRGNRNYRGQQRHDTPFIVLRLHNCHSSRLPQLTSLAP